MRRGLYAFAGCFATAIAAVCANRLLSPTVKPSNVNATARFVAASRGGAGSSRAFSTSSDEGSGASDFASRRCFMTSSKTFFVRSLKSRSRERSSLRRDSTRCMLSVASRSSSTSASMSGCRIGSRSFSRRIAARDSKPETFKPARTSEAVSAFFTASRIARTEAVRTLGSASRFASIAVTS
ncbi:MAG: hypothetical protein E6K04_02755 [Methanobacteriota archaeon]|nr:MAG: hypothetical protein E6K04_02755 [Euryarchaeota archaeon]